MAATMHAAAWVHSHLYNRQDQQQHCGGAENALVAHNLEWRDGKVSHKEVLKRDLGCLDALTARQMRTSSMHNKIEGNELWPAAAADDAPTINCRRNSQKPLT